MAVIDPIQKFYAKIGRYPGNNKQWWVARSEVDDEENQIKAGDFRPDILDKLFSGNNAAPKGHYILNAFLMDREAISGVTGIPDEITDQRPSSVAFFSGRVWYACNSNVYFSQVLTSKHKAGLCHQEADPTSEDISDLVATDGGMIPIPEAHNIIKILPNAGGVLVFAQNGVWFITGTQSGFTAMDVSVNKVSPIGCRAPRSIVETEQGVFYWSETGIIGIAQQSGMYGPIPGAFQQTNIAEETIQTLFNDIPANIKQEVKALYDPKANVVKWLYRDEDVEETCYNRVLTLNLTLGAFYPWKFEERDLADPPKIKGAYIAERANTISVDTDIKPSQIEYITVRTDELRIAQARNHKFVDWAFNAAGTDGVIYDSYVETGYELFDDAMRNKNITYLFSYLKRTENSYDEVEGLDRPSSCYLTVKWDWAGGPQSNRWTTPVQVYRHNRLSFDPDTGFDLIVTKHKVRGNGKAIQFRFGTDEAGKDFDLHGWSIAVTGNAKP